MNRSLLLIVSVAVSLLACAPRAVRAPETREAPVLDGVITPDEWRGAEELALEGGQALLRREGSTLHVALAHRRSGIASVLVSDGQRVWVLHASAALGSAVYQLEADGRWSRVHDFAYAARDPGDTAAREAYRQTEGWLANVNPKGGADREFSVEVTALPGFRSTAARVVLTYLHLDPAPQVVLSAPEVNDGAVDLALQQGAAPESLSFDPHRWLRVPLD